MNLYTDGTARDGYRLVSRRVDGYEEVADVLYALLEEGYNYVSEGGTQVRPGEFSISGDGLYVRWVPKLTVLDRGRKRKDGSRWANRMDEGLLNALEMQSYRRMPYDKDRTLFSGEYMLSPEGAVFWRAK